MTDASLNSAWREAELAGPVTLMRHSWGWFLLRAILALIFGLVALFSPVSALTAFVLVFAAFSGIDGSLALIAALHGAAHRRGHWGLLLLRGIIGIAIAVLFLLLPGLVTISYSVVLLALLASWAVIVGIIEIVAAARLRRDVPDEWFLGLSGLISLILGGLIWFLLWSMPMASMVVVGWMLAVWALAYAFLLLMFSLRLRRLAEASKNVAQ